MKFVTSTYIYWTVTNISFKYCWELIFWFDFGTVTGLLSSLPLQLSKLLYFQLSGSLLATYSYGAPEFDSGIYTQKSDVYSFGVVMLELFTGRMSYDG